MSTMVLPRVPLVIIIGSGITGACGVVAGAVGGVQVKRARVQIRRHTTRYESRHTAHLAKVERANAAMQSLGRTQERAQRDVIFRMRDFLERHAKQVRAHEQLILDGVDASNTTQVVGIAKLDPDIAGWVRGIVGAALIGSATPAALRKAVSQLAKASTGAPIANLRGAAAERATRAFLGGGSLASGGGGMALGATVLKVSAAGPSVLVAGLTMKNRGTKARTEADNLRTAVDVAFAQLDVRDQLLRGVRERAHELDDILIRLVSQATNALDLLESEPFDIDAHGKCLQTALVLVTSVRNVATAPVADEDGNLDMNTEQLIFNYRDARKETTDA
ncbi:hypothetical protein OU787_08715 [Kitasatospora sp. YST-16]|uniref:hypothetical protein n=1 Tax=Kitasatospora sp. YST-16 TaxID=2998080 RepID=UPI002284F273|nr:hypothetical protein [Kitasatospora sp. YST-16]WAL71579.1 hypothetical protein OU787_08715 [Kitasatospora sp. YST-16]WNW37619.1 hypothetical protein RKE32_08665 [Streptomyces sp. Li-HN-5-13]